VKELLGSAVFENPKPLALIKRIIQIGMNDGDTMLDFFCGSATTAQALLEVNEADGGNRKFICIQLPEPVAPDTEAFKQGFQNIADIALARITASIKKINQRSKTADNIGVKVFELGEPVFKLWKNPTTENELMTQLQLLAQPVDKSDIYHLLFDLMLKMGYQLIAKVEVIELANSNLFTVNGEAVFCFQTVNNEILRYIIGIKSKIFVCLDSSFACDADKINIIKRLKEAGVSVSAI